MTDHENKLIKRAFRRARAELSDPGFSDEELLEACEQALYARQRTMVRMTADKAVVAELDRRLRRYRRQVENGTEKPRANPGVELK